MNLKKSLLFCIAFSATVSLSAQVWNPNMDANTYKNPIIFADYSDPDVTRVDDDFYMVASSFNCMPGIPILHSKDLVNWTIVNHVYNALPLEKFDRPQHGRGAWAPAIREHKGKFYVYFCTPDDGLFMAESDDILGEWDLHWVEKVANWEDPCPLWDEDGNAYLVRSKVCGDELYIHKMSSDGRRLLDNGKLVYKDLETNPTIEGPKFLKKDGYYYILAPAGGVPVGWQTVLRSKNIYGPYEEKVVLHKGDTEINGPHQGGLVELKSGDWWFIHFQSRDYLGRIVHLQPVTWKDGWPLMGEKINNDGIGQPVMTYQKPIVDITAKEVVPQTSDEINTDQLGLQWQWQANPKKDWFSMNTPKGAIQLKSVKNYTQNGNFWFVPNLLLQKFPAPSFTATTKISFHPQLEGEKAGLAVMGKQWAYISLVNAADGIKLGLFQGDYVQCEDLTTEIASVPLDVQSCYLRVEVIEGLCKFSYSIDNVKFRPLAAGYQFKSIPGLWIGAKVGIFSINPNIQESEGFAEFDWFRVE